MQRSYPHKKHRRLPDGRFYRVASMSFPHFLPRFPRYYQRSLHTVENLTPGDSHGLYRIYDLWKTGLLYIVEEEKHSN